MDTTQLSEMALRCESFKMRIQYLMVKAAIAKLNAANPSSADILLGQKILDGKEEVSMWALGALTNPSIAAGAHSSDGSSIIDPDLEFAVNSLWPAFSQ